MLILPVPPEPDEWQLIHINLLNLSSTCPELQMAHQKYWVGGSRDGWATHWYLSVFTVGCNTSWQYIAIIRPMGLIVASVQTLWQHQLRPRQMCSPFLIHPGPDRHWWPWYWKRYRLVPQPQASTADRYIPQTLKPHTLVNRYVYVVFLCPIILHHVYTLGIVLCSRVMEEMQGEGDCGAYARDNLLALFLCSLNPWVRKSVWPTHPACRGASEPASKELKRWLKPAGSPWVHLC